MIKNDLSMFCFAFWIVFWLLPNSEKKLITKCFTYIIKQKLKCHIEDGINLQTPLERHLIVYQWHI